MFLNSSHAGPWRRFAAIIVLIVAAAASLATTPPSSSAPGGSVSGRVTLGPDRPEVRIPFTVTASDEALDGHVRVHISTRPVWIGVADEVDERGPDISVETLLDLLRPGSNAARDGRMSCGRECVGSNELVVRWPTEVAEGSLSIAWTIEASSEFDTADPPDGAEMALDVQPPPSDPEPLIAREVAISSGRPMVIIDFRVSSEGPLGSTVLSLQRPGGFGSPAEVRLSQVGEWRDLLTRRGLPIDVPEDCRSGPCSFDITTVVSDEFGVLHDRAMLELIASGAEGPVSVVILESGPWESSSSTDETLVSLGVDARAVTLPLHVELTGNAGHALPLFSLSLSMELDERSTSDARVSLSAVPQDRGAVSKAWVYGERPTTEDAVSVAARCDGVRCIGDIDLYLRLKSDRENDEAAAVVRVVVDAVLLSPAEVSGAGDLIVEIGAQS